jgi:hypothetical protein
MRFLSLDGVLDPAGDVFDLADDLGEQMLTAMVPALLKIAEDEEEARPTAPTAG